MYLRPRVMSGCGARAMVGKAAGPGSDLHLLRGEQLARAGGDGVSAGGADVGKGAALPRNGADEFDEVALWQAASRPLEQAGAERVPCALGQVVKCIREGLRKRETRFRLNFRRDIFGRQLQFVANHKLCVGSSLAIDNNFQ